jgi:hypothetical protein
MTFSAHMYVSFGSTSPHEMEENLQLLASCAQGVSMLKLGARMRAEDLEEVYQIMICLCCVLAQATCGIRRLALTLFSFDAQVAMLLTAGLAENRSVRQLQFNQFNHVTTMVKDGMNLLLKALPSSQARIQRLELLDCTMLAGRMVGQLAAASTSLKTLICHGPFTNVGCVGDLLEEVALSPHLKRLELLKLAHSDLHALFCWMVRMTALRFLTISFAIEGTWSNGIWLDGRNADFNKRNLEASVPSLASALRLNDSLFEFMLQDNYCTIPSMWTEHNKRGLFYGKRNRHLPEILQEIAGDSSHGHISDSVPLLPSLLAVSHQYARKITIRIVFNQMLTTYSIGSIL